MLDDPTDELESEGVEVAGVSVFAELVLGDTTTEFVLTTSIAELD